MLLAYNSCITGVGGARGSIGLPSDSFRGYDRFCVVACFDLRIRKMLIDMPATRKIGIPAPKPASKAILGFVLLEEVCGTVVPLVEAVVEAVVEAAVEVVVGVVVEAVVGVVVEAVVGVVVEAVVGVVVEAVVGVVVEEGKTTD